MTRLIRGAFVIARRDFTATVLSKTFLFFLLGPIFPLLVGGVFAGIGANVAVDRERPVIAVIASNADFERLSVARDRLAVAIDDQSVARLVHYLPEPDLAAQQERLLGMKDRPVRAVLSGGLDRPMLTGEVHPDGIAARQLGLIIADASAPRSEPPRIRVVPTDASSGSLARDRTRTAQIGQMVLFFLTLLLSGMVMSQLIEEKSNKIIEVVAAAMPIDAMFLGKLFAMLAASVVGIVVWTATGAALVGWLNSGGLSALPTPAVGWPEFLALAIVYFAMNYLLLGAVFLTIGAQASTAREVQTMSMPVTFGQLVIFGFAATAVGSPDSLRTLAAAIFPLSSPMVMLARAAERPDIWPHLVAIVWQVGWVAVILHLGAKLFRKTVMKSGPRTRWWRLRRA